MANCHHLPMVWNPLHRRKNLLCQRKSLLLSFY
jgi:hypothetical protein